MAMSSLGSTGSSPACRSKGSTPSRLSRDRERLFATAAKRYPQLIEVAQKAGRVISMIILIPRGAPESSLEDAAQTSA